MANTSPWSKIPELHPAEQILWEQFRDLVALQARIDYMGRDYPKYKAPMRMKKVESEDEVMKFLSDILDGKI